MVKPCGTGMWEYVAGALSFYAQYRFHHTKEFHDLSVDDWFDNRKWFDIKLLCDLYAEDNTKEMVKDSYSVAISKVLKRLGLPDSVKMNKERRKMRWKMMMKEMMMSWFKKCHLGRVQGSKTLEFLEENDEAIRKMGLWNPSVFDNSYSSKLPMGPMRKLAGFHGSNQMF
jgi:hypothetical protein